MTWRSLTAGAVCALAVAIGPSVESAEARSCGRIANPYPDTRYDGVDLRRIRAQGVSCRTARRVARGAHREALRIAPPVGSVRRFTCRGWRVRGELRGSSDGYVARRAGKRVRWLF